MTCSSFYGTFAWRLLAVAKLGGENFYVFHLYSTTSAHPDLSWEGWVGMRIWKQMSHSLFCSQLVRGRRGINMEPMDGAPALNSITRKLCAGHSRIKIAASVGSWQLVWNKGNQQKIQKTREEFYAPALSRKLHRFMHKIYSLSTGTEWAPRTFVHMLLRQHQTAL